MVTYTANYAAGTYTLSDMPPVAKIVTQVPGGGQTDYFFTSSNIYNASMFALQQPGGDWLGALFYGRTVIAANGEVGFVPDAQVEGNIGGVSADAFAVDYVIQHGSNDGLRVALFAGDDTLIGNGRGGALLGEAGDDLIIGGNALDRSTPTPILDGGAGDDVVHAFGAGKVEAYGGKGADFLFMSDAAVDTRGGQSVDTFFYAHVPGLSDAADIIGDFEKKDLVQFDPSSFTSLATGFSRDNFALGLAAKDADDFLIFNGSAGNLFYDPDGDGPQEQVQLAHFSRHAKVSWENILVSDAIPVAGDPGATASPAHHDSHLTAIHAAIHVTGLLP